MEEEECSHHQPVCFTDVKITLFSCSFTSKKKKRIMAWIYISATQD
jgi:hypothetical protein